MAYTYRRPETLEYAIHLMKISDKIIKHPLIIPKVEYDIFVDNIPIVFVYQNDKLYGAAMFKDDKVEVYTTTGRKVTKTTPKVTIGEIDVALKQISLDFPK
jgi:hypothetical protein